MLVALEGDPVDHRVLLDVDDEVAGFGASDVDVREELGRVEVVNRLIERVGGVDLARTQVGVGTDRFRLETLVAFDGNGANHLLLGRNGRCGRSSGSSS